jgi:uncharacterized SAM-binding protein YcdF (DUF218 family)
MFNAASRFVFLLIDPPALIFILLVFGWIVRKRRPKLFAPIYAGSILTLFLLACPTTSGWLVRTLEDKYPDRDMGSDPEAQAIVVLGGSMNLPSETHHSSGITSASDRILVALRLYRAGKAPYVVASGGDSPFLKTAHSQHEAGEMRSVLEEWGLPESAILVEDASINTHQNGLFTRRILQPRGINRVILVTSAIHMPRAAATFRKAGFEVVPVPADFLTGWTPSFGAFNWLPNSGALADSSSAIHEWIGLLVYRVAGWA